MIELAAAAVALLAPYLVEAAHEAAKEAGKAAPATVGHLLSWLREKLTPRGKEALAEMEQQPALASNREDVKVQITKLLEQQPALADELKTLLKQASPPDRRGNVMTLGAGAKGIAVVGSGNTSSIS